MPRQGFKRRNTNRQGGVIVKQTTPIVTLIVAVFLWAGAGIDLSAPLAPPNGSNIVSAGNKVGSDENPAPGIVREVSAYNVGVKEQTNKEPCIGATGRNLCTLVARGLKICAANFVEPDTILNIEGYGKCIVLDRMNRRFARRVDIAMMKDEIDRAQEFGIQRRHVEIVSEPSLNTETSRIPPSGSGHRS